MRVVPEEGPPGLAVLPARTDGPHVLLDRPLAHADAELEQFAADPFGAPQPVGSGHGLDQVDELHAQPPPCPPPPGLMVPEEGEQVAMPAEEGVGLDHREGIAPRGVQPGQEHQDKPVLSVEAWARWRRRVGVRGSAGGGARSRRQAPERGRTAWMLTAHTSAAPVRTGRSMCVMVRPHSWTRRRTAVLTARVNRFSTLVSSRTGCWAPGGGAHGSVSRD